MDKFTDILKPPLTVEEIKKLNWKCLSDKEKLEIKLRGRPTPEIILVQSCSAKGRKFCRKFNKKYFERFSWLCSSDITNSLYCFPCLLCGADSRIISKFTSEEGFKSLSKISLQTKLHSENAGHMRNCAQLKLLGSSEVGKLVTVWIQKNCYFSNNLPILNEVVSAVFFMAHCELPFKRENCYENTETKDVYLGYLEEAAERCPELKSHMVKNIGPKLTSPLNKILDSVFTVYRDKISLEVSDADYLSVVFAENKDIRGQAQIVINLKYINNTTFKAVKRFWGCFNLNFTTEEEFLNCLHFELYKILQNKTEKLISQTFVETRSVLKKHIQSQIKLTYPNAYYNDPESPGKDHLFVAVLFNKEFYNSSSKDKLHDVFSYVSDLYPSVNPTVLISELHVYYENSKLYETSFELLLPKLIENDLVDTFKEMVKLLKILVTVITDSSYVGKSLSTINRIQASSKIYFNIERLNALYILSLEKVLIKERTEDGKLDFKNKVIENYCAKDKKQSDIFNSVK